MKNKLLADSILIWKILNIKEKRSFILLVFMMMIGMIFEVIGIGLILPVLSFAINPEILNDYEIFKIVVKYSLDFDKKYILLFGIVIMAIIYILKAGYMTVLIWNQSKFSHVVQRNISKEIFWNYIKQDYRFHMNNNSAHLIQNMVGEVNLFTVAIQSKLILLSETFILIGICVLLFSIQPLDTIVVTGLIVGFIGLYYLNTRSLVSRLGAERQMHEGYRIQHIQQGIIGIKDVKISGREDYFLDGYDIHNQRVANIGKIISFLQNIPRVWLELSVIVAVFSLIGLYIFLGKSTDQILPALGLFIAAAFRILPSGGRILNAIQALNFYGAAIQRLYHEKNLPLPIDESGNGKLGQFNDKISMDRVCFDYGKSTPALRNVSLEIRKGEFISIIGHSGSGKTTFLHLILGFLQPTSGSILVDGLDINRDLRKWRSMLGYVPQDIFITDGSVKDNIAFGILPEFINEDQLIAAVKMAQLDEFIDNLPEGFDTKLGERGVRMSGGQRQRIGIARALYSNPEILILDEATNSLDKETETEVMNAIFKLKRKKTIILVAHNLSTTENCDRVVNISHITEQ